MERLGIRAFTRLHFLNQESAELVILLRLSNGFGLVVIDANYLLVFYNHVFAVVLLHHLILMGEKPIKFIFQRANHADIVGPRIRTCNSPSF